jgi:hypothetical protein
MRACQSASSCRSMQLIKHCFRTANPLSFFHRVRGAGGRSESRARVGRCEACHRVCCHFKAPDASKSKLAAPSSTTCEFSQRRYPDLAAASKQPELSHLLTLGLAQVAVMFLMRVQRWPGGFARRARVVIRRRSFASDRPPTWRPARGRGRCTIAFGCRMSIVILS